MSKTVGATLVTLFFTGCIIPMSKVKEVSDAFKRFGNSPRAECTHPLPATAKHWRDSNLNGLVETNKLKSPNVISFNISKEDDALFFQRVCKQCAPSGLCIELELYYSERFSPSGFQPSTVNHYENTNIQDIVAKYTPAFSIYPAEGSYRWTCTTTNAFRILSEGKFTLYRNTFE